MSNISDVSLEIAGIEDAEILTATSKRAFDSDSEAGAPGPGGPPGYDSLEWNISMIKNQWLQYYKILSGDTIAGGFIAGTRGSGYQVCERIWIDPSQMRKGLGSKTFDLVWKRYPSAELWVLGTPEWNTRTNPFYQSIGFIQIGRTYDYPGWDGIYYQKLMKDETPSAISRICELLDGQKRIIVEGTVESVENPRTVKSGKTGEYLQVANVMLSDDSGTINLVLWNDRIRQVKPSTRIRIEEGNVTSYREELQLNVGQWGTIISLV